MIDERAFDFVAKPVCLRSADGGASCVFEFSSFASSPMCISTGK
jgi:hypothetical protein